jgi:trans-aconitate 3-methyltransferase
MKPVQYTSAAKCLRPGGTLAIWTCSSLFCHPGEPNAAEVQAAFSHLEDDILGPYMEPGNKMARQGYETLTLPWTVDATRGLFDEAAFFRKDWDRNGKPSAPPLEDGTPGPFAFATEVSLEQVEKALGSASAIVRWREAHPDEANTPEDPVHLTLAKVRTLVKGKETMVIAPSCSMLLMRKL